MSAIKRWFILSVWACTKCGYGQNPDSYGHCNGCGKGRYS